MLLNRANASLVPSLYLWRAAMSSTQTHKTAAKNYGALLNASSELEQLRQENELLKIQIEQLKRQIEQMKESNKKPNDRIDTLEEIIEERDDDIDTLKKEIDLSATVRRYDSGLSHRHSSSRF
jgi:peptidoglycan hydrolase CwlO-like protein